MAKKSTTKSTAAKKTTTKKTKKRRPRPEADAAPKAAGLGQHPRRRKRTYNYADHGDSGGSVPGDDKTLKPNAKVRLVRPVFKATDSLIFRPLPCLDDEDVTKFMPYRTGVEPGMFTDWIRSYPAAKYIGMGDEAYTFLLYDKTDPTYDRRSNPYVILYRAIYNAVEKDYTAPDISWGRLIKGRQKALSPPTDLFFIQGLIFKRGSDLYVGPGKMPQGGGADDDPHIVQLSRSAGLTLVSMADEVNPEWTGSESNFEKAMLYGDLVHPNFGRFIRIFPKGGGEDSADIAELDSWGSDADVGSKKPRGGGAGATGGSGGFQGGYGVSIDDVFITGGHRTAITPKINQKLIPLSRLKKKTVWFDDIFHFPSHEEICLMLAKGLKGARSVLEFGWQDHPEFLTPEVRSILANAKQIFTGSAAVPSERDRGVEEAEEWAEQALTPGKKKKKRRGASVPDPVEEGEEEEEEGYGEEEDSDDAGYEDSYGEEEEEDEDSDDDGEDEDGDEEEEEDDDAEYDEDDDGEEEEDDDGDEEDDDDEEDEEDEDDEDDEDDDDEDAEDADDEDDGEYDEEIPAAAGGEDEEYEDGEYEEDEEDEDDEDDEDDEIANDDLEGDVTEEEEKLMAAAEEAARRSSARSGKKTASKSTDKAPTAKSKKKSKKSTKSSPAAKTTKAAKSKTPTTKSGKARPTKGATKGTDKGPRRRKKSS